MGLYITLTDLWHKGVFTPADSLIELAEREAKYLAHAIEEIKARAEDVVDEVKEAADEIGEALKGRGAKAKAVEAKTEDK